MRILITGSREWPDTAAGSALIFNALSAVYQEHGKDVTLVHGDAKGADRAAARIAYRMGWKLEPHPASWSRWGQSAGRKRNDDMVALGADLVLAFWDGDSPGTHHCINAAIEAGLRINVYFGAPSKLAGTVHEFNVRSRDAGPR